MTFVGVKKYLSVTDLLSLIKKFAIEPSYYFLRWTHEVSKHWEERPEEKHFPMLEGQMFNKQCELRWKHKPKNGYEVLLLSIGGEEPDFIKIGESWQIQEREAYLISPENKRFPKSLPPPKEDMAQRYFVDEKTATVHFVALTINRK
ncbi:hypothetical protein [Umezakia ovalisporum]|uniref:hypothetical protein n=1 Tax=Umezakia ovalisporum TaxID=75695 RepID=UPI002473D560|nr:hypothetical protein [Umezakia ovalisporum]MDH6085774.1 hypothetical protein [Umezakia ovalisporum TAC611]